MALTRDQILAKRLDLPRKEVEVPGVGPVYFRVLSVADLLAVSARARANAEADRSHDSLTDMVRLTACDEAGEPLFGPGDDEALLGLPLDTLKALAEAGMSLNSMADGAARKN